MPPTRLFPGLLLALIAAPPVSAADGPLAVTPDDINSERCTAHGDGRDLGPAPKAALAALLGLAPPADAGAWATGPVARERRHFRVAFQKPVAVGTVCTACPLVAVLKPDAAFPGDPFDEAQWQPLATGSVRTLPAGTTVRALRFTYEVHNFPWDAVARSSALDPVILLKGRFYNPEPIGGRTGRRLPPAARGAAPIDEWIGYWPDTLPVAGIVLTRPPTKPVTVSVIPEPSEVHPRLAKPADWKPVATEGGPFVLAPPAATRTRALRVHSPGETGVMPLVALGDKEQPPTSFVPPSPFAVPFEMPLDGFVAVNVTDATGKHVRRLVAEVERGKGPVLEPWDLRDDDGRPVRPGTYHFRGIARPPLKLTYEMTAYNPGKPAWAAPVPGGGGWMADHAPPTSACSVGDALFFGAAGAEFGVALIATDRDGKKVWQDPPGALRLVSDGRYAYAVNNDEVTRIDPSAKFARTPVLKWPYSDKVPAPSQSWIHSEQSGAAAKPGTLCMSVNSTPAAWVRSAITPGDFDARATIPHILPHKVHVTELNRYEQFFSAFQAMTSSTAAAFGPAPTKGPLANTLVLALTREVPVGGVVVPDGDVEVWALRQGKALPAAFKEAAASLDGPTAPAPKGDPLDLLDDLKNRFDPALWVRLKAPPGRPGLAVPAEAVTTKVLVFTGPKLKALDYALVLDRPYRDAAAGAKLVVREGRATPAGGWDVRRGADRPLSPADPATAALVWDKPVKLRGFNLLRPMEWAGVAVDVWTGPEDAAIAASDLADDAKWKPVYQHRQNRSDIRFSWHTPRALLGDFGATLSVRALRVRVVEGPSGVGAGRPAVGGFERLVALEPVGKEAEATGDLAQRITVVDLPEGDRKDAKVRGHLALPAPSALAFDRAGVLYAACAKGVVRVRDLTTFDRPPALEVVLPAEQAGRPRALAFDADGLLYVLDGAAKQIKVFDPATGKGVRTIGKAGGIGPYDPATFTEPVAMAIDSAGKVWVVEQTFQPKRISRWTREGQYESEWLGPTHYGGGGMMDPGDRTVVNHLGMKFRLDWEKRTTRLEARLAPYGGGSYLPDRTTYVGGRRYLVGDRPVVTPFGDAGPTAVICAERAGVAVPLVATGVLADWKEFARSPELQQVAKGRNPSATAFVWCDADGDGKPGASEVQMLAAALTRSPYIGDDLSLNFVRGGTAPGLRLRATGFGNDGVPVYDASKPEEVAALTGETLVTNTGETLVMGHTFLDRAGKPQWTYPDRYSGVQASYATPWGFTDRPPGVVAGSFGPVGQFEVGGEKLLCVGGNNGDYYAFTADGLLAAAIVGGPRGYGKRYFSIPDCEPGVTDLSDLRKTVENFHGHVTKANDGKVYAIAGKNHITVMRVDGLERMQRVKGEVTVTAGDLERAGAWVAAKARVDRFLAAEGPKVYPVRPLSKPPVLDGDVLTDWKGVPEVTVRTTRDVTGKPAGEWRAKLAYDADNVYVAGTVTGDRPLRNAATDTSVLFQKGDGLDLHLGLDPAADATRADAVPGDVRVVFSVVGNEPVAVLYRYRLAPRPAKPTVFKSPVGELEVDEIRVLANVKVQVRQGPNGWALEAAVPWAALGGKPPAKGGVLRGDLGFLTADPNGVATVGRYYWANRSLVVLSDLPSEARVHPNLWGEFRFEEPSVDALLEP
ncbi:hypothetical protein [Gemmata sp.]|uniref:hypothetical protein n=1 Tax=Gemmata sp. TaxID=1914242 RepID=UPI003F723428